METFTNNQWGTTYGNAQRLYKAMLAGRKTQDDMYLKWGMESKEVAAVELWNSEYYTDDYRLPVTLSLTTEESSRAASIASEISTFAAERMAGYITGERTWEEYDTMVEQMIDMGLNDLVEIYQAAMNRYLER